MARVPGSKKVGSYSSVDKAKKEQRERDLKKMKKIIAEKKAEGKRKRAKK